MSLQLQLENLRHRLKGLIRAGEYTGAEVARLVGISESVISTFINGKRDLSIAVADRIKDALKISDLSLIAQEEFPRPPDGQPIPVVHHATALKVAAITPDLVIRYSRYHLEDFRTLSSKPAHDREGWTRFVAIVITRSQAKFMHPVLPDGATLVIDRHYQHLGPRPDGGHHIFAVNHRGFLAIGYVEPTEPGLTLRSELSTVWLQPISPGVRRTAAQLIVGRICQMSVEL